MVQLQCYLTWLERESLEAVQIDEGSSKGPKSQQTKWWQATTYELWSKGSSKDVNSLTAAAFWPVGVSCSSS